ncbi:dTDP-fucosamine acetyltransferase [Pseudoalteromonas holothuriae]|uniref:dTDP-fucosamine acetyltransferase n=1 Tax=Pseudoalteromonas holothuriae TaxID=2963714 RepID=A0ABM9GDJ5_9GAMM|nr:GNAT family N-acetyltransferase [Pseudoalteromonas sp. CIP111951]CAH9049785.1 dTDP-fucosamine acetyltransferase [Pseudoalteromonas sp. CIP111951]
MQHQVIIREAHTGDHPFIFSLSPHLAEVAQLPWHTDQAIKKMQDEYIAQMLTPTNKPTLTLIAEVDSTTLGFIHVRTHTDGISGELCATVPLLAVSPKSQGLGLGKQLMTSAEQWAKKLGCRLLHLEVFANNTAARGFYQQQGFEPEMIQMVKVI